MRCLVYNCKNNNKNKKKDWSFYMFPKDNVTQKKWIDFCRCKRQVKVETDRICNAHFTAEDFERNLMFEMGLSTKRPKLLPGAFPTEPPKSASGEIDDIDEHRKQKKKQEETRLNKQIVAALLKDSEPTPPTASNDEITLEEMETIMMLESKIENLRHETDVLKEASKKYSDDIKSLESEIQKAKSQRDTIDTRLRCMFTEGQVMMLKGGLKRKTWKEKDIAESFTLYATSAKVYKLLRKMNYPLPGVRTLQTWVKKCKTNEVTVIERCSGEIN